MSDNKIHEQIKGFFKYISTVISWTIFVLLTMLGVILVYYYISVKLYSTKGEKYEPKFSIYTVVSGSMQPTINKYDVIVNLKVDDIKDIKVNDVITFISTWQVTYGMTVTHRVVDIRTLDDGSVCLVTRGDNNTQEDQACVSEENLVGVVKAVVPGLGKIQTFLSSAMGWFLIIILPALYIIVKDIIKILNSMKNKDKSVSVDKEKEINKEITKNKDNIKEEKVTEEKIEKEEGQIKDIFDELEKLRLKDNIDKEERNEKLDKPLVENSNKKLIVEESESKKLPIIEKPKLKPIFSDNKTNEKLIENKENDEKSKDDKITKELEIKLEKAYEEFEKVRVK